jgi:small-conductance mechanosensitive channel
MLGYERLATFWGPVLDVVLALLIGLALDYGSRRIAQVSLKRGWSAAASIFAALRGVIVLYVLALGLYSTEIQYPWNNAQAERLQDHLALGLAIFATTIAAARLLLGFVDALGRFYGDRFPSASLLASVARISVYVIGLLSLLQSFNIAIAPILTVLGVGGLAVSLALRDTLAMLFAGIQIIAARQLRAGDYIKLDGGFEGFVTDITWRNTTIRDLSENLIVVPNDKLASTIFTNYSVPDQRMTVRVDVLLCYGNDLDKAEALALDTARETAREFGETPEPPYVRFTQGTELGILMATSFVIRHFSDRFTAQSAFLKRFYLRCVEEEVAVTYQPFAKK